MSASAGGGRLAGRPAPVSTALREQIEQLPLICELARQISPARTTPCDAICMRQRILALVDQATITELEVINAAAEADMLKGNPITGAHHRAIERRLAELKAEATGDREPPKENE